MEKEEILKQSQMENKFKDQVEEEIDQKSGGIGGSVGAILALFFTILSVCLGYKFNCGYTAIIFSICAGMYVYKAIKMPKKLNIVNAVLYTLITIAETVITVIVFVNNAPAL